MDRYKILQGLMPPYTRWKISWPDPAPDQACSGPHRTHGHVGVLCAALSFFFRARPSISMIFSSKTFAVIQCARSVFNHMAAYCVKKSLNATLPHALSSLQSCRSALNLRAGRTRPAWSRAGSLACLISINKMTILMAL